MALNKGNTMNGQIKKASSALTPKASHLTVISNTTKERRMNNSTAVNLNNQVDQAYNATSEALDAITQSMEYFGGLHALFNSIFLQMKDNPIYQSSDILHAAKMGCRVCADFNNSLDCHREDLEKHLKALGGFSHE